MKLFDGFFDQFLTGEAGVSVLGLLLQHVGQGAGSTFRRIFTKSKLTRINIRTDKTDSVDLGQLVRITFYKRDAVHPEGCVNSGRECLAYSQPMEEGHHFPETLLILPAFFDSLELFTGKTFDFEQLFRILIQDLKGFLTKFLVNPFSGFGTNSGENT